MTTPSDTEARALLIKKLLNKAEAKGTTPAERDALNAKATELMIKWGIEEAMLADADRVKIENIIRRNVGTDAPKSYSYEVTSIGVQVAEALNCRGLFMTTRSGTHLIVVGFESDVDHVETLFHSLMIQCATELANTYVEWIHDCRDAPWSTMPTGTEKYNWKRSFIRGYANGVSAKLKALKQTVVAESAPGTDLVLIDRKARIKTWMDANMRTGVARSRRYIEGGYDAGGRAGRRANIGGTGIGGGRTSIGGK